MVLAILLISHLRAVMLVCHFGPTLILFLRAGMGKALANAGFVYGNPVTFSLGLGGLN